jgi:hypothetical protein
MLLSECKDYILSTNAFPQNWINNYSFSTEDEIDSSFANILLRINNVTDKTFEKLNISIISGDYIHIDNSINIIQELLLIIEELSQEIEITNFNIELLDKIQDVNNQINETYLEGFIITVRHSLKEYKRFLNNLNRKYKDNSKSVFIETLKSFPNKNNFYLKPFLLLRNNFLLNLKLANIDHNLSVKSETLTNLLKIKFEFDNKYQISKSVYDKILVDKCNFLIKKLTYRYNEDSTNYYYSFDYDEVVNDFEIEFYIQFDKLLGVHYEKRNNHQSERELLLNDVYNKIDKNLTLNLIDYHILIKQYKDNKKSFRQLERSRVDFQKLYDSKVSNITNVLTFDKSAYRISINYIINNEFSLFLDDSDSTLEDVHQKYIKIKDLQESTQVFNYFPCFKYSNYLIAILDKEFKKPNLDTNELQPILKKLNLVVQDAHENFVWSQNKNLLAFQLSEEECKFDFPLDEDGLESIKIFLSSSFILPLNFDKIKIELKELNRKVEKFNTLFEVHENLMVEKQSILELRDKIQSSDKRSVEILGVFSAIIIFSSSSIEIFSAENITFKNGITFMLTFSYCLILFISLIWIITREKIQVTTKYHISFFISLLIISLISALYSMDFYPFNK